MIWFMMNLGRSCDMKVDGMKQRKQSTGELISSVAFLGAAFWLAYEAKELIVSGENLKGYLVYLGAFLSLLASLRFRIQRLVQFIGNLFWKK